jgi:hypothetical protein
LYFTWVEENPLFEEKIFSYMGDTVNGTVSKMRAMTLQEMCTHIGMDRVTWYEYRKKTEPDFSTVCAQVDDILYSQKFTGAAAGLLNHAIIARDLGLVDKVSAEHSGPDGAPIATINAEMSDKEALRIYQQRVARKVG